MVEFLLLRHAINDFVKTGKLAGWTAGVHLNAEGRAQATALGERLKDTHIDAAYTSPLERCVETAQAVVAHHPHLTLQELEDIGEVRYGDWQGAELNKLAQRKLWRAVQITPSRVQFPNGETIRHAQMRAVNALERLAERHPRARIAVFSHSDVIKLIIAHYMGLHLDLFQRIEISPASLSILRLGYLRASIVQVNETSYLPKFKAVEEDPRQLTQVNPVRTLVIDAVGTPGNRVFYLQVTGDGEASEPISLVIEKTQATMLAARIEDFLTPQGVTEAGDLPTFTEPQRVMFRLGQFTLQYSQDNDLVQLTLTEMLGADQGTPRTLELFTTRLQLKTLADSALRVAARGRSGT